LTRRDLIADIAHSAPLERLEEERAAVAGSPMVWHALLLPHAEAPGRFVLTGHINCHDCALCSTAGDFRDGGHLAPWRASYPDCTSTEEEAEAYATCADAVVRRVPMPSWVVEAFYAAYYESADGPRRTGWTLPPSWLAALDAWGCQLPAIQAARPSMAYFLIDALFESRPDDRDYPGPIPEIPDAVEPPSASGASVVA
jgi:hypothetical protein